MIKEFIFSLFEDNKLVYDIDIKAYYKDLMCIVTYADTNRKQYYEFHKILSSEEANNFYKSIKSIELEHIVKDYFVNYYNHPMFYCWRLSYILDTHDNFVYITGQDSYPLVLNEFIDAIKKLDDHVSVCNKIINEDELE